jgi:hypothetical protein
MTNIDSKFGTSKTHKTLLWFTLGFLDKKSNNHQNN